MPGFTKADEIKIMAKLLRLFVDKKKSTMRQDITDLIDQLNTIRFNRTLINKQLNELNSDHL